MLSYLNFFGIKKWQKIDSEQLLTDHNRRKQKFDQSTHSDNFPRPRTTNQSKSNSDQISKNALKQILLIYSLELKKRHLQKTGLNNLTDNDNTTNFVTKTVLILTVLTFLLNFVKKTALRGKKAASTTFVLSRSDISGEGWCLCPPHPLLVV